MTQTIRVHCNIALAVLALLAVSVAARAGMIATYEKRVNAGSNVGFYTGFPVSAWVTDTGLNSGTPQQTWVSYALGLTPTNGEKLTAISVQITSPIDPAHGMLQRWNFDPDTETFLPSPSSSNVSSGDTHLIQLGSFTGVAPNEGAVLITTGGPPKPADTATRRYGYSGSLNGIWGFNSTEQSAQTDSVPIRFAYLVLPRGGENYLIINVVAAASNTPAGYTFTNEDFGPPFIPPAEPTTATLIGLALAGGLGFRRRHG